MYKVFENKDEDYKILNCNLLKVKETAEVVRFINKMFKDGYEIYEDFSTSRRECPKIKFLLNLKFIKKSILDSTEIPVRLSKRDELLEYAKEKNLEVPTDLKLPSQIKKYIKENI